MTEIAHRPIHETAVYPDQAPMPASDTLAKLAEFAETTQQLAGAARGLAQSQIIPVAFRGKPEDITAVWLKGMEVGFSPMASLEAFDVIQGRVAPRAITIAAIMQSRGHEIEIVEWTDERCEMRGRRNGEGEWQTVVWDLKRAAQLGLTGKDQWKKQPKTMLRWRATAEMGRIIAADALLGVPHSAEELRDMAVEGEVVKSESPHGRSIRDLAEGRKKPIPQQRTEAIDEQRVNAIRALLGQWQQATSGDQVAFVAGVIGRQIRNLGDLTPQEATLVENAAGLDIVTDEAGEGAGESDEFDPTLDPNWGKQ